MADTTIAEAISLLTKVSADTVKRLNALEAGGGSVVQKATKVPRKVVKKAEPVIITDFGPKAEKDLKGLGGSGDNKEELKEEKNKNSNLLGLLGLAGAAALALKFLFDGKGFTGLVQGFQKAFKTVTKFASKVKGVVGDIGEKIGTFTDDIGAKAKGLVDDVMAKVGTWADDAKAGLKNMADNVGAKVGSWYDEAAAGLKNTFDAVGQKLSSFSDDLAKGFSGIVGKAKSLVGITDDAAAAASDVAKGAAGAKGAAPKKQSWFSKVKSKAKAVSSKVVSGAKAVSSKVVSGAKAVGGKVASGAKAVGKKAGKVIQWTKDKILKPVGTAIKKVKPLKLLKGLAKSPLLAPVLESFFAAKDINDTIDQYGAGEIDEKTLNQLVGERIIKAITGVIGGAGGAIIGGALGSVVPVAGNIIGAIAGGVLGDVGGRAIGGLIAKALGPKTGEAGAWALGSPLFKVPEVQGAPIDIEDGIITKDGQVIRPDRDDTLYAMKDGGPLTSILQKGSNEQITLLTKLTNMNEYLLKEQTEMLKQHAQLLSEIADKTGVGGANIISNNSVTNMNSERSLRDLQEMYV